MTTSQRFYLPIPQVFTNLGTLAPGWKLYFYQTKTTTLLPVYSDVDLIVELPNPVLTNNDGHFVDGSNNITSIYFVDSALYKAVLKDENDIVQWTADPCDPFTFSIENITPRPMFFAGTTTGTSSAYVLNSDPAFLIYSATDTFELVFHTACAANPTLKYGTNLPALNLKKQTGQGTEIALLAGDVNGAHIVRNDGIDIIVLDPITQMLYLGTPPTVTIAAGVGTLPNSASNYLFDTEGAGTTDDLDTINGGVDGQKITIGNVADARNVIIKHNTGNIINPAGIDIALDITSNKVEMIYSGALSKWIVTSAPSLAPILYIQDQKPNGTDGGASSAGMNIRVLNTVLSNTISGASLASNQITLPAGTFAIDATAPCFGANGNKAYLYNVTDSTNDLLGTSNYNVATIGVQSFSRVIGILTIASAKVFELRQYIQTGLGGGLGTPASAGQTEVYSQISIQKLA